MKTSAVCLLLSVLCISLHHNYAFDDLFGLGDLYSYFGIDSSEEDTVTLSEADLNNLILKLCGNPPSTTIKPPQMSTQTTTTTNKPVMVAGTQPTVDTATTNEDGGTA